MCKSGGACTHRQNNVRIARRVPTVAPCTYHSANIFTGPSRGPPYQAELVRSISIRSGISQLGDHVFVIDRVPGSSSGSRENRGRGLCPVPARLPQRASRQRAPLTGLGKRGRPSVSPFAWIPGHGTSQRFTLVHVNEVLVAFLKLVRNLVSHENR